MLSMFDCHWLAWRLLYLVNAWKLNCNDASRLNLCSGRPPTPWKVVGVQDSKREQDFRDFQRPRRWRWVRYENLHPFYFLLLDHVRTLFSYYYMAWRRFIRKPVGRSSANSWWTLQRYKCGGGCTGVKNEKKTDPVEITNFQQSKKKINKNHKQTDTTKTKKETKVRLKKLMRTAASAAIAVVVKPNKVINSAFSVLCLYDAATSYVTIATDASIYLIGSPWSDRPFQFRSDKETCEAWAELAQQETTANGCVREL